MVCVGAPFGPCLGVPPSRARTNTERGRHQTGPVCRGGRPRTPPERLFAPCSGVRSGLVRFVVGPRGVPVRVDRPQTEQAPHDKAACPGPPARRPDTQTDTERAPYVRRPPGPRGRKPEQPPNEQRQNRNQTKPKRPGHQTRPLRRPNKHRTGGDPNKNRPATEQGPNETRPRGAPYRHQTKPKSGPNERKPNRTQTSTKPNQTEQGPSRHPTGPNRTTTGHKPNGHQPNRPQTRARGVPAQERSGSVWGGTPLPVHTPNGPGSPGGAPIRLFGSYWIHK